MLQDERFRQRELLLRWSIPGPVFLAWRETYDPSGGVGMYDERLIVEDRDYYCRLLARNALGFLDVPVSAYRVHGANLCRRPNITYFRSFALAEHRNAARFRGFDRLILVLHSWRYSAKVLWLSRSEFMFRCLGRFCDTGLYGILHLFLMAHDVEFKMNRLVRRLATMVSNQLPG